MAYFKVSYPISNLLIFRTNIKSKKGDCNYNDPILLLCEKGKWTLVHEFKQFIFGGK